MTTQQQPYTHIQFNDLPGWARDHILALEAQAAALTAAREALETIVNVRKQPLASELPPDVARGAMLEECLRRARAALQQLSGGQQP